MEVRRRLIVDDVDRASGRAAAEQRRPRAFQNLDPLHAVQRMRDAAELVAVGKTVAVDLGVEPADQEMVEIAQRILAARIDAARVGDGVAQRRSALLGQHLAGNDLNADRQVRELGAGLAERGRLLQRRPGIGVVRTVAVVGRAGRLTGRLRRLIRTRRSSFRSPRRRCRCMPRRRTIFRCIDLHRGKRRGLGLCLSRCGHECRERQAEKSNGTI